ncbi:MAG: hypothetical protein ACLR23_14680 [Clostridia bacterium]
MTCKGKTRTVFYPPLQKKLRRYIQSQKSPKRVGVYYSDGQSL